MKHLLFFLILIFSIMKIYSQDTIFMKNGQIIPATIIETGEVEIKYKKFNQPEPAGIYTVFKSDVSSVHRKDGSIAEAGILNQNVANAKNEDSGEPGSYEPKMRLNFGLGVTYFNRNTADNLNLFWRFYNNNDKLSVGGNPRYYSFNFGMGSSDTNKRNWFGMGLQIALSPKGAISASNTYIDINGIQQLNEIQLRKLYYNISIFYARTLNYKKNLMLVFEPSLDIGNMSGTIVLRNDSHKVSAISNMGSHFALGMDWIVSKRVLFSVRTGKQFMKIEESHENKASSTGASRFYANPSINDDFLYVNWGGFYASAGISFSLYTSINKTKRR